MKKNYVNEGRYLISCGIELTKERHISEVAIGFYYQYEQVQEVQRDGTEEHYLYKLKQNRDEKLAPKTPLDCQFSKMIS